MLTPARFCSPEILLASFLFEADPPAHTPAGDIYLVCGPSGCGKTSWLLDLHAAAREAGLLTAGLLSPPRFANTQKTGIDLLDAASGFSLPLATRCAPDEQEPDEMPPLGWVFDEQAFAWGNQVLRRSPACDLFFLDELGPLEWDYGCGLVQGFAAIERRAYRAAFISVRPSLLEKARTLWPLAQILKETHDAA